MSTSAVASRRDERLDAVFHALADGTRRRILQRLGRGRATVGEVAAPFTITLAAVSKHLDVLEGAGLIARERDGRFQQCRLQASGADDARRFLADYSAFWGDTLDALADWVEDAPAPSRAAKARRR
jgi:DNA-binding transcriptional ArsR family regulator